MVEPIPAERQQIPGDVYGSEPPQPQPDGRLVLDHYTNEAGVLGIASTGALHATSARYLNDASEISHAFDLAAGIADYYSRHVGVDGIRDGLASFAHYVRDSGGIKPNICIVSFSEDPNVLSQWRAYGGYSIGFDFDLMSRSEDGWRLLRCRYTGAEQESLVRAVVEQSIKEIVASPTEPATQSQALHNRLYSNVLWVAPAIKHNDFREEREWRLVSPPTAHTEFETRVGRHSLVQYAIRPLPRREDGTLPIGEVVVGPGPHQQLAMSGVTDFLFARKDVAMRSVRPSQTPFLP